MIYFLLRYRYLICAFDAVASKEVLLQQHLSFSFVASFWKSRGISYKAVKPTIYMMLVLYRLSYI